MKKLMILVTLILVATLAFGQTWTLEKEETDIENVMTSYFFDADTGLVVLDDSQVEKTTDGGATWTTLKACDGTDWNAIEFVDAEIGYAGGDDGFIYKTTDGGANWTEVGDTANYTEDITGISVIDANTVYCSGNDTLVLKTVDSGTNWEYQTSDDAEGSFKGEDLDGGIVFTDVNNGVVITDANEGFTWYTTDGGTTWNFKEIASLFPQGTISKRLYDVSAGGSTIAVVGYHNTVFVSTDGGANYTLASDVEYGYKYFECVDVIDDNNIIAGGKHIIKTTDGGANWDTLAVGSGEDVSLISYVDASNGFIFSDSYQWAKTTNGTDFTTISDWPQLRFLSIDAITDNKMVASTWGCGDLTESADGGATWSHPTNIKTNSHNDIWEIEFYDANNGLLAGDYGHIWLTSDGGATWTETGDNPIKTDGDNITASIYLDANNVLVGGEDGRILISTDAGVNWVEIPSSGTEDIQDLCVIDANRVVAVSNDGEMLLSTSTIDSFYVSHVTPEAQDLNAITWNGDVGIIPADNKYVYMLDLNLGLDTLELIYTASTGDDLLGAEFINHFTAAIVGEAGMIILGNENEITEYTAPTTETLYDVTYANNKLWIVGDGGVIVSGDFGALNITTDLYINEFLASNDYAAQDDNGDYDDYIELYNAGSSPIDIGGLYVTDDLSDPTQYQIADTNSAATTIAAGDHLIIWADKDSEQGILHAEIKLSGDGEQVGLFQIIGDKADFVDSLTFDAQETDVAYGRYPDGSNEWGKMQPTPDSANVNFIVSDLLINEFLASNDYAAQDENGDYDDYIELYNAGSSPIDIGGLYVTDDLSDPTQHQIADTNSAATTIAAGDHLIIWADKESEQGILHAEIKLSGDGEQVGLVQAIGTDTVFIDSLTYTEQITDTSYGRFPDGGSEWGKMQPTPDSANVNFIGASAVEPNSLPKEFALHQNYPNPFNPTTNINFDLPKAMDVKLVIYDIAGRKVNTLVNSHMDAGKYNIVWNGVNDFGGKIASGIYIYQIQAGDNVRTMKMAYIK